MQPGCQAPAWHAWPHTHNEHAKEHEWKGIFDKKNQDDSNFYDQIVIHTQAVYAYALKSQIDEVIMLKNALFSHVEHQKSCMQLSPNRLHSPLWSRPLWTPFSKVHRHFWLWQEPEVSSQDVCVSMTGHRIFIWLSRIDNSRSGAGPVVVRRLLSASIL